MGKKKKHHGNQDVFFVQHKRTQGVAFNFALIRRFAISIKKEEARMIRKGGGKNGERRRYSVCKGGQDGGGRERGCGAATGPGFRGTPVFYTFVRYYPPPVQFSRAFSHLYPPSFRSARF